MMMYDLMLMTAWLISSSAAVGGALLFLVGLALPAIGQQRRRPLLMSPTELKAMAAAVMLSVLGSSLLFVFPAYASARTFLEVNGSGVIPLFIVPIAFTLLPFLAQRSYLRPALQGLCAFLLGAQAAIGMSGYGLFFGPSGLAVLIAGLIAMRNGRAP